MMAGTLGDTHNDEAAKRKFIDTWIGYLADWFPDLDTATYFVPPLHVNTINVEKCAVPSTPLANESNDYNMHESGKAVFEMKETSLSDTRDDRAHLLVLQSLWNFSKGRDPQEVMVVLSRYEVSNYMTKTFRGENLRTRKKKLRRHEVIPSDYFPVPNVDGNRSIRRGDFDILIIHKKIGFIVIEVKAIGDLKTNNHYPEQFLKKLEKGLFQLDKLEETLTFMTSDMVGKTRSPIPITKLLALPNVSRDLLCQFLNDCDGDQQKKFQTCLNDTSPHDALALCLCSEEINSEKMTTYWNSMLFRSAMHQPMEDAVYKEIVARFCGPVSTVKVWSPWHRRDTFCEVRTIGEATHEMENRYTMRILRRQQLDLLQLNDRLVYLTGPPRSGKTLVLLLKAMQWAENGDALVVVRAMGNNPGHFISHVLYNQIIETLRIHGMSADNVHLETVGAKTDPQEFVDNMRAKFKGKSLRLLIDEMWVVNLYAKLNPLIEEIKNSNKKVVNVLRSFRKWSAMNGEFQQISDVLKQIDNVVNDTLSVLNSINYTNVVARKLLTEKVQQLMNELTTDIGRIQTAMDPGKETSFSIKPVGTLVDFHDLQNVLEIVENTRFYADVIMSWLASPIIKKIAKIVSEDQTDITLWCAGFWPRMCPETYRTEAFKYCIGCPPHVQRIMEKTETLASHEVKMQYNYVTNSTAINPPLPAEGEFYHLLNHNLHMSDTNDFMEIYDCQSCGKNLADLLLNKLDVGKDGQLQFRDVLIVGRALLPMKPTSIFLTTLSQEGIQFKVVVHGTDDLKDSDHDQVPNLHGNHVLVTNTYHGHGLERAVVVFVPVISKCNTDRSSVKSENRTVIPTYTTRNSRSLEQDGWMESLGRHNQRGLWFVASRCAAELVIFHV